MSPPGAPGGCGGMYTANTMATAIEVRYEFPPGSSSHPAESADKKEDIEAAGRAAVKMLELDLKPSDILTREAFEDAITVTMALGGSTNATFTCLPLPMRLMLICHLRTSIQSKNVCPQLGRLETIWSVCLQDLLRSRWCACGYEELAGKWLPFMATVSHMYR